MRLLSFLLAAAAPATAQQAPPAAPAQSGDVVVTGVRLSDSAAALAACIARHCPVDEDVAASLAHAENQFVAGKYKDARTTLLASRARNRGYAKAYPVPVSDLLRANARIAAHLGEGDAYRIGTIDTLAALKAGLPDDDPRVLIAQLEVADSFARFARYDMAEAGYQRIAKRAHSLGLRHVEGVALLHRASLLTQLAAEDEAQYGTQAGDALALLTHSSAPELAPYARAARVLEARQAQRRGDKGAVDRLLAEFRGSATTRPVLLFGEPIHLTSSRGSGDVMDGGIQSQNTLMREQMQSVDDQWVDVGFWIAPDGRTTDVDVLRQSDHFSGEWIAPVLTAIRSRRYAPLKLDPNDPGMLRVERYTFTARWTDATGTRLRVREATPRIEMLDLSTEQAAAPAAPAAPTAG